MIAIATLVMAILFGLAFPGAAGELCLLPSAANGLNVSFACFDPIAYQNEWVGFRSDGGVPCHYIYGGGCLGPNGFEWSISGSPTDPLENQATAPVGQGQLYLWFYCTSHVWGLATAEFDLGGTIAVHSFTPQNGFVNAGDATHLLLSVGGCPWGPVVAGIIHVHDPIAVDATTWGRIKSTYR